jgi:hypothetical protein
MLIKSKISDELEKIIYFVNKIAEREDIFDHVFHDWGWGEEKTNKLYLEEPILNLRYKPETHIFYELNDIPIFFVTEDAFYQLEARYPKSTSNPVECNAKYKPTEYLAFYTDFPFPQIVMCWDRILETITELKHNTGNPIVDSDEFKTTFTIMILIHEIAHYHLDSGFWYKKKFGGRDAFYEWMEEFLANFISLQVLHHYFEDNKKESEFFCIIKHFTRNQPDNYAFGLKLFELDFDNNGNSICEQYMNWWAKKTTITEIGKNNWLKYVMQSDLRLNELKNKYNGIYER